MIVNSFSIFSNLAMKLTSSISQCETALILGKSFGAKFGEWLITLLANLVYTVCKWVLYLLDVVFLYVRQLSGAGVDTSSLASLTSGESDMVFNMLFTNSQLVTQLLRQLTGLTLVVIIVITIIAIIKTQFDAIKTNSPGDNGAIIKRTFKSILLIIITPAIAIGGIMMSNILIKALYNATNVTGASSIGSAVFSLSSTSANSYRLYAKNGKRIPIYFEFSEQEMYLDQIDKEEELTQKGIEYLTSPNNPAYQTHLMFDDETYYVYEDLSDKVAANVGTIEKYYSVYDQAPNVKDAAVEKIRSYREEYFVMADVIDYAVKTSQKLYFKTIEEVLDSAKLLPDSTYQNLIGEHEMTVNANLITFSSDLYNYDEINLEAGEVSQIQYNHKVGSRDELYGAVFIVTTEKTKLINNVAYTYYEPFMEGFKKDNITPAFESDFIKEGNLIAAKGFFTADLLPTAIKRDTNSTDLVFYRDTLKEYDLGDVAGIAQLYEKEVEKNDSIIDSIKGIFQSIFNPITLVPGAEINLDAVKVTYKKQTEQQGRLKNGGLHISYMFNKTDDLLSINTYSLNMKNFFQVTKLNFLILVMGSFLLLKVCASAIFALVKRIYDLFLLFIFYPTSCATMPIDDGLGYQKWITSFIGKLFAAYGLILGINFVLMVVPIMENVQIFSAAEIASSTVIRRIGMLFFNLVSHSQMAKMLNLTVAVLFELVAFSLLNKSGIVSMMSQFFPGEEDITKDNPAQEMANVMGSMTKVVTTVGKAFSGVGMLAGMITPSGRQKVAKKLKASAGKLERLIPGSAIFNDIKDKQFRMQKKFAQVKAMRNLKEVLGSASSDKDEVEKALNGFLKAQSAYTKTLTNSKQEGESVRSQRKAEGDQVKQEKKKHIMESSRAGDDGGSSGITSDMFDSYSDDELEKLVAKSNKFADKNEKRYNKGKLGEASESKYNEAQDVALKGQQELERRKQEKTTRENLKDEIFALEDKGLLTEEEKARLKQAKAELAQNEAQRDKRKEAYNIKHNRKFRKKHEKEQRRQLEDEKLFRHEATGRYGRKQKKRLGQIQKDISNSEQSLVDMGFQMYTTMSVEEIDAALDNKRNDFTAAERAALKSHRDKLTYKQDMISRNDNEYASAARLNANRAARKDEGRLSQGGPVGTIRQNMRDKSVNKNISDYEAELAQIQKQLDQPTALRIDANTYKERRKLNERKAELESKILQSKYWNENNTESGKEAIRAKRKRKKKEGFVDKYTHLTDHAIEYLKANNQPITEENINRYIANVQRGRAMREKKKD